MVHKKFWLGMTVLMLTFGLVITVCGNGSLPAIPGLEDGPGTGGDAVTGITLTPPSLTLAVGGTATLTAANQSGAAIKAVNWSSINPTVAAVDANGTVIGIAIGSATIIAVTTDGGKFATCDVTVSAEAAPVTGVSLDQTSLSLLVGGSDTLSAEVIPAGASNKAVNWTSTNPQVATVDANGMVSALSLGLAIIVATTEDGGKVATCAVSVIEEAAAGAIAVTGVSLNPVTLILEMGQRGRLSAVVQPANASNKTVFWDSSNHAIAEVDANGNVTAKAHGTATIYVSTVEGGHAASAVVTVSGGPPTGVELFPPVLTLETGKTGTLTAIVIPADARNKAVTWTSGNPAVATVDSNGTVTAKAPGTVTIYVLTVDGNKTATCVVTVNTAADAIPATLTNVLGRGYDATGRYADSSQNKAAVLDLNKLQQHQLVKRDPNVNMAEFQTITGENIAKYLSSISSKVSSTSKASLGSVASFKLEANTSFNAERTMNTNSAFATQRSYLITDGYYIDGLDELEDFFTESFKNDAVSMSPERLIEKYGTHVILGGLLGGRAEHHLSVEQRDESSIYQLGAYVKASAEAKFWGASAGTTLDVTVDEKYEQYFNTNNKEERTLVYGGNGQYGHEIHTKGDYDNWFKSIKGNEVWMDFYPGKLVPLSELVSRNSAALETALKNYGLTVFFNLNGGSGAIPYSLTGAAIPLLPSGTGLSRSGHVFMGWNTRADGTGTNYSAGSSLNVTDNIVLYARWYPTNQLAKDLDDLKNGLNPAKSGDKITLKVNINEEIAPQALSYGGKIVEITLEGVGGERTISLSKAGAMFNIGSGVTLILGNNIKLFGINTNNNPLVCINSGGTLIMNEGSTITGNTTTVGGGGVSLTGGGATFTMNGGTISGNTAANGGGVLSYNGATFIMSGGTISGNTAVRAGGGVRVDRAVFIMSGGTISGNTCNARDDWGGGGVQVLSTTFTKTGGTIYGYTAGDPNSNVVKNSSGVVQSKKGHAVLVTPAWWRRETTAGPDVYMNSSKSGKANGWE